jgi:hypothetical protein
MLATSVAMRIGYVVLAYKSPGQLRRLVQRIASVESSVAIHVDLRTDDTLFREMSRAASELVNVHFLRRRRTYWGGFELVDATLRGMEHLVTRAAPVDYVILLTGQDYPLRSPAAIERFLRDAGGRSFVHHSPLPYAGWGPDGGLNRLENWYYVGPRRYHFGVPWERKVPGGLQPFGGEAYWCLTAAVADYVVRFAHDNRKFVRFFEHVFIPDEIFFHTVVMNSRFRDEVVNDTLHYVDWDADPAPAILTKDHFARMVGSGKLFARKFDATTDDDVLDMLDDHIERHA